MTASLYIIFWGSIAFVAILLWRLIKWLWKPEEPVVISRTNVSCETNSKPVQVKLIASLEELMFDKWILCAVNADYTPLIISGNPTKEQIHLVWMKLLSQHYELTESKEALRYVKQIAKIEAINTKIFQVSSLVNALRMAYDDRLTMKLKHTWGYVLAFSPESLKSDLLKVEIALQNDKFKLEKVRLEYEKEEKLKKKTGQKQTKELWMKSLYALENHFKREIPSESTSVYKFDLLCNQLSEYNNALKEKNKGNGIR